MQHIRFTQKTVTKPDEEFIEFIRVHTGKIRPLAESDLESFLSEGKILLNIGKPFHLDGIGTLQKNRAGAYEYYPGLPIVDKLENFFAEKETKASNTKQHVEQDSENVSRSSNSGRTAWIVLAVLVGLGAIIWGGYTLYNRDTNAEGDRPNQAAIQPPIPAPDTTTAPVADSTALVADSSPAVSAPQPLATSRAYKFVFRLASRNYVLKRYNELKPSSPQLNWDTKDSVVYRLYVSIPASPADTARIRDSLRLWYGTKKVIIE